MVTAAVLSARGARPFAASTPAELWRISICAASLAARASAVSLFCTKAENDAPADFPMPSSAAATWSAPAPVSWRPSVTAVRSKPRSCKPFPALAAWAATRCKAPTKPFCAMSARPEETPRPSKTFWRSSLGLSIAASAPAYCVDTSAALPVTPVVAAKTAKSSCWLTPSALASGVTRPMAPASSGRVVCPSRTVCWARSATRCTAPADVSP